MPPRAASGLKACKWQVNGCPGAFPSRSVKNHERACPFRSENIIQAGPGLNLDAAGNHFHMIFCSTKYPTDENFIGANALLAAAGVLAPSGLRSLINDNPESGEAIQGAILRCFYLRNTYLFAIHVLRRTDVGIDEFEPHFNDEYPPIPRTVNRQLQLDDIKITTHPSCNQSDVILSFEDYSSHNEVDIEKDCQSLHDQAENRPTRINDKYPCWHPFRTRLDFEIAELMHAAQMKECLGANLLSLIQQASGDNLSSDFTFSGYTDLKKVWDHAREIRTSMVSCLSTHSFFVPLIWPGI